MQIFPGKYQISLNLGLIENNHGSGKVLISNDFDENLIDINP